MKGKNKGRSNWRFWQFISACNAAGDEHVIFKYKQQLLSGNAWNHALTYKSCAFSMIISSTKT